MFAESVCMSFVFFSLMGPVGAGGMEVAAADDQSRWGTCVCNCILSPTEGVKNPC